MVPLHCHPSLSFLLKGNHRTEQGLQVTKRTCTSGLEVTKLKKQTWRWCNYTTSTNYLQYEMPHPIAHCPQKQNLPGVVGLSHRETVYLTHSARARTLDLSSSWSKRNLRNKNWSCRDVNCRRFQVGRAKHGWISWVLSKDSRVSGEWERGGYELPCTCLSACGCSMCWK